MKTIHTLMKLQYEGVVGGIQEVTSRAGAYDQEVVSND